MKQTRKLVVSFSNGQAVSLQIGALGSCPLSMFFSNTCIAFSSDSQYIIGIAMSATPMLTYNATGVFSLVLGLLPSAFSS